MQTDHRANYNLNQFAQELLSTFGTDLGEVALVPMTGGVFTVTIWHAGPETALGEVSTEETILWDRKRDGGFPGMFNLLLSSEYLCTCNINQHICVTIGNETYG